MLGLSTDQGVEQVGENGIVGPGHECAPTRVGIRFGAWGQGLETVIGNVGVDVGTGVWGAGYGIWGQSVEQVRGRSLGLTNTITLTTSSHPTSPPQEC